MRSANKMITAMLRKKHRPLSYVLGYRQTIERQRGLTFQNRKKPTK